MADKPPRPQTAPVKRPTSAENNGIPIRRGTLCDVTAEQLIKEYNPKLSYPFSYQKWFAGKILPYNTKSKLVMEEYIAAVNRLIPNPEYLQVALQHWQYPLRDARNVFGAFSSSSDSHIPLQDYGVFRRIQDYRKYGQGILTAPRAPPSSPSISPPRSRPSTPQRVTSSNEQLGKMFKGKNPLVKAEHQSQLSMLHLLSARNEFGKLIARLPKSVDVEDLFDPNTGMPQFVGFAAQIQEILTAAMGGVNIFCHIVTYELRSIIRLLKDCNGLIGLAGDPKKYGEDIPPQPFNDSARVYIKNALNIALKAYEKLGRSGSQGGWSNYQDDNPDLIQSGEIHTILMEVLYGIMAMNRCQTVFEDILKVFVYCDVVEKSFLLQHIHSIGEEWDRLLQLLDNIQSFVHGFGVAVTDLSRIASHTVSKFSGARIEALRKANEKKEKVVYDPFKRTESEIDLVIAGLKAAQDRLGDNDENTGTDAIQDQDQTDATQDQDQTDATQDQDQTDATQDQDQDHFNNNNNKEPMDGNECIFPPPRSEQDLSDSCCYPPPPSPPQCPTQCQEEQPSTSTSSIHRSRSSSRNVRLTSASTSVSIPRSRRKRKKIIIENPKEVTQSQATIADPSSRPVEQYEQEQPVPENATATETNDEYAKSSKTDYLGGSVGSGGGGGGSGMTPPATSNVGKFLDGGFSYFGFY